MRRAAVIVLGLALAAAPAAQNKSDSERLERIREEIEAREAKAREYADEASGYLAELEGVDRKLQATRQSLRRLRRKEKSAEKEMNLAQKLLAESEQAMSSVRGALERRLIALYRFSSTGGVAELYSAKSFQNFARKRQALARILLQDRELFARYRTVASEHLQHRDRSRTMFEEHRATRREVTVREDRLRRDHVERKNLVELLGSRAKRETRAADELREAAERLEEALNQLPREKTKGHGLRRGRLLRPVDGPVRLGFGHQTDPEFGTVTLRTGIEIEAKTGLPVRAVGDGRVLFAGWFRGYGQIVIVDHGKDTVTVSGYLEEILVNAGDEVATGKPIGTVGETGSLSGPGLYFEIRHKGEPVDPRAWIQ